MLKTKTIVRLAPTVYEDFAKQFPTLRINEATTALQVAEALGKERVLKALREQLVTQDA